MVGWHLCSLTPLACWRAKQTAFGCGAHSVICSDGSFELCTIAARAAWQPTLCSKQPPRSTAGSVKHHHVCGVDGRAGDGADSVGVVATAGVVAGVAGVAGLAAHAASKMIAILKGLTSLLVLLLLLPPLLLCRLLLHQQRGHPAGTAGRRRRWRRLGRGLRIADTPDVVRHDHHGLQRETDRLAVGRTRRRCVAWDGLRGANRYHARAQRRNHNEFPHGARPYHARADDLDGFSTCSFGPIAASTAYSTIGPGQP